MNTFKISTDRLSIRPLIMEDYENWLFQHEKRLPSQHRHDIGKIDMSECTEKWFASLLKKHNDLVQSDTAYIFGIFRKKDGVHIGSIDFSTHERGEFQWGRIGYSIHNQFWKMGYGSEAVKAALQMGFNDLKYHRIEAHINLDNLASQRLIEKVGMEYECTRKRFIFEFGEWTDNLIYYKNFEGEL